MTDVLVYHVASGQAFFSGVGLILLAWLHSIRPVTGRSGTVRIVLSLTGLLLIAASATPLPVWFYDVAAVATLAWLVGEARAGEGRRRLRLGGRVVLLLVWSVGVAMEVPYHRLPALPALGHPPLVVVGDSVSAGLGSERETWPRMLAERRHVRVVDLSRLGATVATALKDQAPRVVDPDALVLVEIGGNDVLAETRVEAFERDLDALLSRLRRDGRTVAMLELPLPPLSNRYGQAQRRLSARHGVPLVPKRVLLGILTTPGATLDTIHLSPAGHGAMAEAVWRVVRTAYAGP